jgi:glycerophosphoryl diester phosphodiesterase
MALTPHTLLPFDFAPPATFAAIAYLWPYRLSRWVEKRAWGAFCAHYTMMGRRTISQHHSVGQCLGTGFIDSPNILFRELNRGVDWLFSNRAAILQKIIL